MKTALESARAYLDKLPAAVSGTGGHKATLTAACWCVRFGLSDTDAMALLREYSARCTPPWTEKELAHKLAAAHRKTTTQARALQLTAPAVRLVWKVERRVEQVTLKAGTPASVLNLISGSPQLSPPPPEPQQPGKTCANLHLLTERHVIRPGDAIPGRLLPVLATWKALRHHPAWAAVQWPKTYENRPTKIRA